MGPRAGLAPAGASGEGTLLQEDEPLEIIDVVHPAPTPVHRDLDAGGSKSACEGRRGELRALIGVEDLRRAEARQRLLECVDAEARVQGIRQPPGQTARQAQSMTATR
jgi:hypothetical protein